VTETDSFVVLCPYAARFPFETWILPKRHEAILKIAIRTTLQNLAWILRGHAAEDRSGAGDSAYNFIIHSAPLQEGRCRTTTGISRSCPR
jgi:UDPglucose--hexose-1-phosphate uridylyltransferase